MLWNMWWEERDGFISPPCLTCGFREVTFSELETVDQFGDWLFSLHHKYATVIAHNMKGYDGIFLLNYLVRKKLLPQHIIFSGGKIMYMIVGKDLNIRVIGSFNHLPMSLSKLLGALGLSEQKKGYSPHLFSTEENQNYVGPYPDKKKIIHKSICPQKNREDFLLWYDCREGLIFYFKREIYEYCRSAVDILRRACMKYRELVISSTRDNGCPKGIDPLQYITIASVALHIYTNQFLPETWSIKFSTGVTTIAIRLNGEFKIGDILLDDFIGSDIEIDVSKQFIKSAIAHIHSEGYTKQNQFSNISIQWLEMLMKRDNI